MLGKITMATLALATLAGLALSHSARAQEPRIVYASLGQETSIPYGWLDFCQRYKGECAEETVVASDIDLTPAVMEKIKKINHHVNKSITPMSDMEHWGVVDQWDIPTDGFGDCEDYALLKRKLLIEQGFPRQALLMTVVKDGKGDGHAVLTVKTTRGEYILDNMSDVVKLWTATPYRFVKRQSQSNQNVWVALGAPTSAPLYVSK